MFWSLFPVGNSFRSGFFSKNLPDSGCCKKVYFYLITLLFIHLTFIPVWRHVYKNML